MKPSRSFASDNNAAVHPEALEAIWRANDGHVVGYGDDPHTESAVEKFREEFGDDVAVFFVFNGTAANVLEFAGADAAISCRAVRGIFSYLHR